LSSPLGFFHFFRGGLAGLLLSPTFRTFITGAGFFSDSYDLFIVDGVTAMLKNLGPVTKVSYEYTDAGKHVLLNSYFTAYCTEGLRCLPRIFDNSTSAWVANPTTVWQSEMTPRYQQQTTDLKNGVSNAALIGSILGQLFFGVAGDLLGRKWCFFLTSVLIIAGCLGSASSSGGSQVQGTLNAAGAWGDTLSSPISITENVYLQLSLWRFVLGFGVGGEYPLAGTISSEGAADTKSRGRAVLYTFSMQGWGKLTAAIVNYGVVNSLRFFGGPWVLDDAWRFALAFGCTLNLLTLPFRYLMEESEIYKESASKTPQGEGALKWDESHDGLSISPSSEEAAGNPVITVNPLKASAQQNTEKFFKGGVIGGGVSNSGATKGGKGAVEDWSSQNTNHAGASSSSTPPPHSPPASSYLASLRTTMRLLNIHRWTLLGTAGTWFLIDVTFYGQSLMNTAVVSEAVASSTGLNAMERLRSSLLSTVWIMLIAIPGYFLAIALVDRLGRVRLQIVGFLACAFVFTLLGAAYETPLRTGGGGAGFVLFYGLTYLFSNAGPNSVTFLLPAESFPTLIRSTAHGISAASGKLGATVGAFGLLELYSSFCTSQLDATGKPNCQANSNPNAQQLGEMARGVIAVMITCAVVATAGAVVTRYFCRETQGLSLKDLDAET